MPPKSTFKSSENAATPTQPSARPIAADTHFGIRSQKSFSAIARTAPPQTIDSTETAHPADMTSRAKGVYVPAMSR